MNEMKIYITARLVQLSSAIVFPSNYNATLDF